VPLICRRLLAKDDGVKSRETAVVSRTFADRFWPGCLPLGRRFRFVSDSKPAPWLTVAGDAAISSRTRRIGTRRRSDVSRTDRNRGPGPA